MMEKEVPPAAIWHTLCRHAPSDVFPLPGASPSVPRDGQSPSCACLPMALEKITGYRN